MSLSTRHHPAFPKTDLRRKKKGARHRRSEPRRLRQPDRPRRQRLLRVHGLALLQSHRQRPHRLHRLARLAAERRHAGKGRGRHLAQRTSALFRSSPSPHPANHPSPLQQFTRPALLNDYPWPQTSLVDVGCGPADTALDLLALHPGLRVTALDLPPVVATAAASLAPDLAGRIAFVAHDYFGPDAMPGRGDAFFARGVLRDYGDDDAARLLAGVREAMVASGPACRLLVNEVLTGPACVVGRGEGVAPSALLAAARDGEVRQSAWPEVANLMAQNAFVVFGGMERTREEMEALMRRVGFRIEKVWRMRSFIVMIECVVDEEWKGPGVA